MFYNKDRSRPTGLVTPMKSEQQPTESRVPGVSAEEVLAAEEAYRTGQEPVKPITKNDGKPFATEKAAATVAKKMGLKPEEIAVTPVKGGFVIIPKGGQNAEAVRSDVGQVP